MPRRIASVLLVGLSLIGATIAMGQPAQATIAAPVLTSVVPSATGAAVTFTSVSGATSYTCQAVAGASTVTGSVVGNTCTLVLGGLNYDVTVSALPGPVTSASWSGVQKDTPAAPTISSASVTGSTMTLNFLPPSPINGAGSVVDYEIYVNGVRQPNASAIQLSGPPFTSPLVLPLNGPTASSYTIEFAANNNVGLGIFATFTTAGDSSAPAPVILAPSAPGILVDQVTATSYRYRLSAPTNSGGQQPYVYEVSTPQGQVSLNPAQAFAGRTVTGVTPETAVEISSRARNDGGWGPSATTTVRTLALPPGAPTAVKMETMADAVSGGRYVVITWSRPAPGGGAVAGYSVSTEPSIPCTTPELVNLGACYLGPLPVGTRISASVASRGPGGTSAAVTVGTVIEPVAPAAPQLEVSVSRRQLTLTVRPTSDGGSPITATTAVVKRISDGSVYLLKRSVCAASTSSAASSDAYSPTCFTTSLEGTSTTDMILGATVANAVGVSRLAVLEAFLVDAAPKVPAPSNVRALPSAGQVTVTWNLPLTTGRIDGFEVVDGAGKRVCETSSGSDTSCTFVTVDGQVNSFRVRGWNSTGDGDISVASAMVASGRPGAPVVTSSRILVAGKTASLEWLPGTMLGTAPVSGYSVRANDGASLCVVSRSERSCTFALPAGFVSASLKALSPAGDSDAVTIPAAQLTLPPAPPGPVAVTGAVVTATQQTPTTVLVTWIAPKGTPLVTGITAVARNYSRGQSPAGTCGNTSEPWCVLTLTGTEPDDKVVIEASGINSTGTSARVAAPELVVYAAPHAAEIVWTETGDREIQVGVGSVWWGWPRDEYGSRTYLKDGERPTRICLEVVPFTQPDQVVERMCQSIEFWNASWGGGAGSFGFRKVENDKAYTVLVTVTNPAGTMTTASQLLIPGADPAPPLAPTSVKWSRQANGDVLVWWKPVPRSGWNSAVMPRYVVRIGAQEWSVGGSTSQIVIPRAQLLKPPAAGSSLSVTAVNRAGDSPRAMGSPITP